MLMEPLSDTGMKSLGTLVATNNPTRKMTNTEHITTARWRTAHVMMDAYQLSRLSRKRSIGLNITPSPLYVCM